MANENMIKFLRGNVANLPQTATAGALYFTKDEGIYLGMEDGSYHRYGDFITVADVNSLPATGAHATCMYYCTSENILARYDAEKGWIQINKQPTAEEMKTLLGLGSMAYKSEVAEGDLNEALAKKINDASAANHGHDNKDVIDGITAEKVTAWDNAEKNAKDYADGLNGAMNTRVEALEAIDHEHANKDLLDTYTQTEADLADAVAKKHSHANADELAKFVDGDRARYEAVVADHLTSADKTTLENSIKEAKKAGTDANTNIETYKVANDARVLAVEEDIAEITGENGILAQAKNYSDGKLATARTEISAEIDADVKVVADDLAGYKTSNDSALAGVKATADAAAVKTEVESALAGKVDKVEGKSLIADTEIARLATLANYDDTQVKADIAKKADAETMTTELGKKVDKVDGKDLIATSEIERLATLHNYDDTQVKADIAKKADSETMTTELDKKVDKVTGYSLVSDAEIARLADVDNYDDAEVRGLIADRYTKEEADGKFALIADAYDDTALVSRVKAIEDDYLKAADKYDDAEVRGLISDNADAIDAIVADYLKAADKTALQEQITANATAINVITNGIDADKIDGLNDLVEWAAEHAPEVKSIKEGIEANAKAIADHEALAAETYETKTDAAQKLTDAKAYTDTEVAKDRERIGALESVKDDYKTADATLKSELQAEIDADVKVVNDAFEAYKTSNDAEVAKKANSADVYAKTETYTQAEVDALISAAHQWGEF